MKKIVFVQKQDGSTYDPVTTFFANKKNQSSANKPKIPTPSNTQKVTSKFNEQTSLQTNSKAAGRPLSSHKQESTKDTSVLGQNKIGEVHRQTVITGKIGRKGDHIYRKQTEEGKHQSIYGQGSNRVQKNREDKNLRKTNSFENKKVSIQKSINKIQKIEQNDEIEKQELKSNQMLPVINMRSPQIKQHNNEKIEKSEQVKKLKERIKQLQQSEKYLLTRIEEHEQKQQKYIKNEQKLAKTQKQSKNSANSIKQITKKLSQKQEEIKKLLAKQEIPYNRKREILLINKINQLKKINKELTLRIKNYKGSDLVQISLAQNKADILTQYIHESDYPTKDYGEIQSLAYRAINQISAYISSKIQNSKKQKIFISDWNSEKNFLINLMAINKKLSLQILSQTESELKLPASNQECINLYNEIQGYRNSLEPIIQKYQLNFAISQENIEIINKLNENQSYLQEVKQGSFSKEFNLDCKKLKKAQQITDFYKTKMNEVLKIYQMNSSWQLIIIAQNLAYNSLINSLFSKIKGDLRILSAQMEDFLKQTGVICQSGNRQSLFLHVKANMERITQNCSKTKQLSKQTLVKILKIGLN